MSKVTKRTLTSALNAAMSGDKTYQAAEQSKLKSTDSLSSVIRKAWTQSGGKALLADWLFDMADDTEAKAGNPFHKARQVCNTRARISVRVIEEEGEVIDIELKPMKAKGPNGKAKVVDPNKAYDSLVKWMTAKSKTNPEFAKALLSFNANAIRKAINDGARDAGVR